jgi:capsule polysaccharide export protein KpsE/RkpR
MPMKRYSVTIPVEFDLPGKTIVTTPIQYACYAASSEQAIEATKLFLADESERIVGSLSTSAREGMLAFVDEVPLAAEPEAVEIDERRFKSSRLAEVKGDLLVEDLP